MSRRVGRRPSSRVSSSERPSAGGSALTTTCLARSRVARLLVSANVGTSVENRLAGLALPDSARSAVRNSPSTVEPRDEIAFALAGLDLVRKSGL